VNVELRIVPEVRIPLGADDEIRIRAVEPLRHPALLEVRMHWCEDAAAEVCIRIPVTRAGAVAQALRHVATRAAQVLALAPGEQTPLPPPRPPAILTGSDNVK
jgi:hypothetical protein